MCRVRALGLWISEFEWKRRLFRGVVKGTFCSCDLELGIRIGNTRNDCWGVYGNRMVQGPFCKQLNQLN